MEHAFKSVSLSRTVCSHWVALRQLPTLTWDERHQGGSHRSLFVLCHGTRASGGLRNGYIPVRSYPDLTLGMKASKFLDPQLGDVLEPSWMGTGKGDTLCLG